MDRRRPYPESLGQLEGGAIRRGAAEVPAGLGFHDGEEVGGSTALVFVIALGDVTRPSGSAAPTSAWSDTGFSSRQTTGSELR